MKAFAEGKIKVTEKLNFVGGGRRHCRERNKCWLPAFSPFQTMSTEGYRSLKIGIE